MHYSQVQDWIDRVALSSSSSSSSPSPLTLGGLPTSQNRKRPLPHYQPDITTGLSSPPRSMDPSDLDATPRAGSSSKRRRVDIPSASTPPNRRRPSDDGRIATPTLSTRSTSTTSTDRTGTSKLSRQRSPVKNMADLMLAEKSIQFSTPRTRGGIPDDVTDLIEHVKAVPNRDKIIPKSVAEAVKECLDLLDPSIDDKNTYTANQWLPDGHGQDGKITWDVADEFKMLQKIVAKSSECDADPPPFLELALAPFQGTVSHWDVTKAPITKIYHPRHSSGNDLQGKMVDYCITLDGEAIKNRVIRRLKMTNQRSIAHTEYQPLRFRPIAVSIETKTPDGSTETARTQLAVWASSHIARLRELAATSDEAAGLGITLPLISIRGAEWDLLLAVDHADRVEIVRVGPIGDTTSIISCYKLLAMVRWLTVWITGTFCEWMVNNILEV